MSTSLLAKVPWGACEIKLFKVCPRLYRHRPQGKHLSVPSIGSLLWRPRWSYLLCFLCYCLLGYGAGSETSLAIWKLLLR